jgi:quinoprotein glucose dehydrogenase
VSGARALSRLLVALLLAASARAARSGEIAEWTHTEGAPGGGRFSPLTDITRENVAKLRVAWHYEHGDFWEGGFPLKINGGTSAESTPIVVDGRLFVTTPANRVIALEPETGRESRTFDPKPSAANYATCGSTVASRTGA